LNKAHDAATNNGRAMTNKRLSIINIPFEKCQYIIYYILNYEF